MRISLAPSLCLALALIHPVHLLFSALPEDSEGSGYDLDSSGSGDWSGKGEMKNIKDHSSRKDGRILGENAGGEADDTPHGSSVLTFDDKHWPANDIGSEYVVVANSKGFLERKDVLAAVSAGGVIGVVLAVTLAAILIYKWQKKDEIYVLGRQAASEEDCHKLKHDSRRENFM